MDVEKPTLRPDRRLRIAPVTAFHPELNGVAMTLHRLVSALALRHEVTVIRPRQPDDRSGTVDAEARHREILRPGFCVPRSGFRFGLPSAGTLTRAWRASPPDVVHIATEGPSATLR